MQTATKTKEKPIMFDAESIRAILRGEKTQTRRVVKPQPRGHTVWANGDGGWFWVDEETKTRGGNVYPPYPVGTRCYIKETWQHECPHCDDPRCGNPDHVFYRATDPAPATFPSWRSPLFMPKWAARLRIEIEDVRAERVQEITREDVLREGIGREHLEKNDKWFHPHDVPACTFAERWNQINGKKPGFTWADNPWVWAYTFRLIH